ncbi:bifunctional 3-(3-hydroxy-phenyl)propionate/3-hydroxycinnamic acid hydroxylase [Burkholderia vietnamiensis]|uniref:bifunctional 3-(3-hydroxy-phenyl)propionate/3-hydroxycinnamic acid hydroxylase n=1 Tax=Burkholderia vietnamiensis TaxID=60552 RepID=UPI00264CA96B|nr:bifunctional 3-(3-hydroxy-phenyl)propionate/3-hydroxycinnamic acid hydroxylase [Burkholderia vietnamiensis]MDN7411657.1 bifunctional 3-(3-hydroxy-phenyl)propionate/3-hydroxycinnamic acid hydroxylase [Burkholderia vietnamiensis]HEF4838360.1 bifunctional 3-(3-hydroxy-phenyl)propionate/3-hydroxycinnamic acid hydroxylase [Burkholderia vietnamiensis]
MRPAFEPAAGLGRAHPHETTPRSIDADVAIIGAGPVGLMIANILGLQGVRVVVVEKLTQIIDYPRAIGLDDEALRVFQSVGLAEALLPHTTPNHWMRFTLNGKCFASIEPRTDEFGWPRRNAFIQPLADQILYRGLERFDHVSTLLGHNVDRFAQDESGVTIDATDAHGVRTTIRAAYMVGADGGNSFVRRTLDVPFEGRTKPNQWIVIDVRNDPIGSPHVYLHCDARRPYVSAALPHGIRRFEFMVMPGETEEDLSKPENMAALVRGVVDDPDKVDYIRQRVYTHNARLASVFRVKRILLAGDAAHIMPVWQGQGYNSGIRDASNLGWKLAMVVKGTARDALLDTYTMERRAHARSMIHLSEVAGDIFAPTSFVGTRVRDAFVRCFDVLPSLKRYFVEMRFKPMPRYEDGVVLLARRARSEGMLARLIASRGHGAFGRLVGLMSEKRESLLGRIVHGRDAQAGTPVGRMYIQPRVRVADGSIVRLDDAIGNRFAILSWGTDPTFGLTPEARRIWSALGGCFVLAKPDPQLGFRDDVPEDVIAIGDVDSRLRDWFARVPESVVLLRPDRFVAGMCSPQCVSECVSQLAQRLSLSVATGAQADDATFAPAAGLVGA